MITCFRCNCAWKACLFPLASGPRTADPVRGAVEVEWLLDPYVEPGSHADPAKHLRFDDGNGVLGQVQGFTDAGKATVETCGLDRPTLVDKRSEKARYVLDLLDAAYGEGDLTEVYRRLWEKGAAGQAFAGMVRAMVWAEFEMEWADLEVLAGAQVGDQA